MRKFSVAIAVYFGILLTGAALIACKVLNTLAEQLCDPRRIEFPDAYTGVLAIGLMFMLAYLVKAPKR